MAKKILVVDDEPSLRELLKAILENEGYEIITANDGKEALKQLEKESPDLILMDMMMPGMSGREVCEKIRANPKTNKQKIVFLTVVKFSEMGLETLKGMSVLDYITKPFDNTDLVKRIKKIVG